MATLKSLDQEQVRQPNGTVAYERRNPGGAARTAGRYVAVAISLVILVLLAGLWMVNDILTNGLH
jgi:hypothetical protein